MSKIVDSLREGHWFARFSALGDRSAWLLMLPFILLWYYFDPVDLKVMLVWLFRAPIIVGLTIILSRIYFPTLKLTTYLEEAKAGNIAAGIVVAGLMLFLAALIMTLVLWTK